MTCLELVPFSVCTQAEVNPGTRSFPQSKFSPRLSKSAQIFAVSRLIHKFFLCDFVEKCDALICASGPI